MSKIKTIGIIGEGKMGTNLFYYLLEHFFRLTWLCSPEADLDKLQKTFRKKIKRHFDAGLIPMEKYEFLQQNSLITKDNVSLSGCDLIIESIPENFEQKSRLFLEIDPIVSQACILSSNSSSIRPSEMVPSEYRKDKFVGLHFFYPVSLKNIVEFIVTANTSPHTREMITGFLRDINRKHLLLKEKDSFILNRIYLDFQNEAYLIVREGKATFKDMDDLIRKNLFPIGVFEFFDSVGNDMMLASITNYIRDYPHRDYYLPLVENLRYLVDQGRLGQKAGKGFFDYDDTEGKKEISPYEMPVALTDQDEIITRLKLAYIASVKRFAMQSHCLLDDLTHALNEYFGTDRDLFM